MNKNTTDKEMDGKIKTITKKKGIIVTGNKSNNNRFRTSLNGGKGHRASWRFFSCRSLTVLNSSAPGDGIDGDEGQGVRVGEGP